MAKIIRGAILAIVNTFSVFPDKSTPFMLIAQKAKIAITSTNRMTKGSC